MEIEQILKILQESADCKMGAYLSPESCGVILERIAALDARLIQVDDALAALIAVNSDNALADWIVKIKARAKVMALLGLGWFSA
jgi:hypothetical protein